VAIFQVVKVNSSAGAGPWTEEWVGALPCTLLAILAFLTAGLTGVARFALYAAVLLATALIATPAGLEPSAQLLLAGSIVTIAGFSLFVRFLARSSRFLSEGLD
jgi:hypothetical protein